MTHSILNGRHFYKCPACGYISTTTYLVIHEKIEYRFCHKCHLDFLRGLVSNVPIVHEYHHADSDKD